VAEAGKTSVIRRFALTKTTRESVSKRELDAWSEHVTLLMRTLPDNVAHLANIALTEILSNAIEHSQAGNLLVGAHVDALAGETGATLQMVVADDGVGIFRQISQTMGLFDDRLALLELAKGKLSTAAGHSGLGVFVSARMLDRLVIESRGHTFDLIPSHHALPQFEWVDIGKELKAFDHGTVVRMALAVNTTRAAQDVYRVFFAPDETGREALHTTEVPVRMAQLGGQLVSRSQARWVVERALQFKSLVLDFEGVAMVGQGFTDEVFRVFATANPQVKLIVKNAAPAVAQGLRMFAPGAAKA
jgi:anti-sigma regulatory factor (Ser/Thr protein kinase)